MTAPAAAAGDRSQVPSTACGVVTEKQILAHVWVHLCHESECHPLLPGNIQTVTFFRALFIGTG